MRSRSYIAILILLFFTVGLAEPIPVQAAQAPIQLIVNGIQISSDVDPVIVDDCTMVPLRVIADNLGRHVSWNGDQRTVFITQTAEEVSQFPSRSRHGNGTISIVIDSREIESEVPPFIENERIMVPLRLIAEGLGKKVNWDPSLRQVCVDDITDNGQDGYHSPATADPGNSPIPGSDSTRNNEAEAANDPIDPQTTIMGASQVSAGQLKALLQQKNPAAPPELADLYIEIGAEYGIRGDIAFCQAAKETKWWQFGGLVQDYQNNYCGLGATGTAATGNEELAGADPARVSYRPGVHGAVFATVAVGVEAHIQHLYAYAVKGALPAGKVLLDPRFNRPSRGCAPRWIDLGGKWAVPGYDPSYASFDEAFQAGKTYGQSILNDYYALLF